MSVDIQLGDSNKDGEFKNPIEWQGDENYRDCLLKIFFMGQRKGIYRWVTIGVCRNDEPAVREWLKTRWNHSLNPVIDDCAPLC